MAKKKEIMFPRNLYKKGGDLVWGKKENTYSTILVKDEEEMEAAIKKGFEDDFSCILREGPVPNKIESKGEDLDDDF